MGNQTTGRSELSTPQNFKEFWSFYVGEHINPLTRFIHVLGTTVALILLAATFLSKVWWGLLLAPTVAYAAAWFSHFVVEKNRPATFRYPLWSLMADFVMLYKSYNNTMDAEVERVKKERGLKSLVIFSLLFSSFFQMKAMAQSGQEFEQMRKNARERYEDFYERKKKQEAWEVEKSKGVEDLKQKRSVNAVEKERDRKEQVEVRKKEIDEIAPLEPAYLKQQKEDKKKELEVESEYAKRKNEVLNYQKKQYPIPEKEEYDLE